MSQQSLSYRNEIRQNEDHYYQWVITQTENLQLSDFPPIAEAQTNQRRQPTMSYFIDEVNRELFSAGRRDELEYIGQVNEEIDDLQNNNNVIQSVNRVPVEVPLNVGIHLTFDKTAFSIRNFQSLFYKIDQMKYYIKNLTIINEDDQHDERNEIGFENFKLLMENLSNVKVLRISGVFPLGDTDPLWMAIQNTKFDNLVFLSLSRTNFPSSDKLDNLFASDSLNSVHYRCKTEMVPKHSEYLVRIIKQVYNKQTLHELWLFDDDNDTMISEDPNQYILETKMYLEDHELIALPNLKVLSIGPSIHSRFLQVTRIYDWIIKQNPLHFGIGLKPYLYIPSFGILNHDNERNSRLSRLINQDNNLGVPEYVLKELVSNLTRLITLKIYGSIDFMIVGVDRNDRPIYDSQYQPYKLLFTHPTLKQLDVEEPPENNPMFNTQLFTLVNSLVRNHRNSVNITKFISKKIDKSLVNRINRLLSN